jgi:hypothetical protein
MVNGDNAWGELVDDIVLVAGVTIETAENFLAKRGYTPDDDCAVSPATRDGLICAAVDLMLAPFPQVPGAAPEYIEGQLAPDWSEILHARVSAAFNPPADWSGHRRAVQMVSVWAAVPEEAATIALNHFPSASDMRMDTNAAFRDRLIQAAMLFFHTSTTTH